MYSSKNNDMVLKYYFGDSESHSYEEYSSKNLKLSDIKCTQVWKVPETVTVK